MTRPLRILWLAGDYFEPIDAGLYRYSDAIVSALRTDGVDLTLVGRRRSPTDSDPDWHLLAPQPKWRELSQLVRRKPLKLAAVAGRDYDRVVQRIFENHSPDLVVVDHLRGAAGLAKVPNDVPVVYCSQNHEISVRRSAISSTPFGPQNLAYRFDGRPMARSERDLVERAALVTVIAPDDVDRFVEHHGLASSSVELLPPPYRGERVALRTIDERVPRRIGIVTDLRWSLKRHNLDDFYHGAADILAQAGVEIVLGGHGTDAFAAERAGVTGLGFVNDLASFLQECRLGVSFEPRGGGLKMKVLDYAFHRVPVLAGPDDLAGIPLIDPIGAIQADTAAELARRCVEVIDDLDELNRMQMVAFDTCAAHFAPEQIGARLHQRLAALLD